MGNSLHGEFGIRERIVSNDIFYAFLISNLEIEFLKKENLTNKSGLGILLHHEVPKCRMIGENGSFEP